MASNFDKVIEFNKSFGVKTFSEPNLDIFEDPEFVESRLALIREATAMETVRRYKEEIPQRYDSPTYMKSDYHY